MEDAKTVLVELINRIEIEDLIKTMAWAMDSGDKELWLSIWSDDIYYTVPQYGIEIKGRNKLMEFGEAAIFTWEEGRFSAITNVMINVKGDVATGQDYYMHYGFPIDSETGKALEEPAHAEGRHFYEFSKRGDTWKITKMEVYVNWASVHREKGIER